MSHDVTRATPDVVCFLATSSPYYVVAFLVTSPLFHPTSQEGTISFSRVVCDSDCGSECHVAIRAEWGKAERLAIVLDPTPSFSGLYNSLVRFGSKYPNSKYYPNSPRKLTKGYFLQFQQISKSIKSHRMYKATCTCPLHIAS